MNLEGVRRRRQTVEAVHSVVHALRAVAAGRIQSAQRAAAAAERYYEIAIRSLGGLPFDTVTSRTGLPHDHHIGLLVMTSEQPLCGALAQNLVEMGERRRRRIIEEQPGASVLLMVVGRRGIRQFLLRGVTPDVAQPGATSLAGLRDVVRRLAGTLAERYASGEIGEVRVIYSRHVSVSEQRPTEERILPPDLPALKRSAVQEGSEYAHYMPAEELLQALIAEYAYIALYRIAVQMFTSEQAARLVAMDAATHSAERMVESLRAQESRARQEQVTSEVLELIGTRFASEA